MSATTATPGSRTRMRGRPAMAVAAGSTLLATLVLVAPPAQAVAPSNDNWGAATATGGLPYRTTVDTTEATRDAVNPPGGRGYKDHTVWYHVNLANSGKVLLATSNTDFSHQLRVYHADNPGDTADQWTQIGHDWGGAGHQAVLLERMMAGEDYYVVIASENQGDGGPANLVVRRPARVTSKLAREGIADDVTGSAILHGTFEATRHAQVDLRGQLRQRVGDHIVQSYASRSMTVGRTAETWQLRFDADRPFKNGQARLVDNAVRVYDLGKLVATLHFAHPTVTLR